MDVIETESQNESPPSQLPADTAPAPSNADTELDALLAEFDAKTAPQTAESDLLPSGNNSETATPNQLDQQTWQDLIGPDPKIDQLQGELDGLKAQMRAAEELKAFGEFADNLQKQLPDWLPPDYARAKLESLAHDPVARLAWETRGINPADAARDLAHVTHALNQLKANPNADPKQVQQLNTLAHQLSVAANSAAILRQARNSILSEARKLPLPVDPDATQTHDEVAAWVRGASTPVVPEAPVNWGRLSGKEFREKVIRDHGFDPGTW